MNSLLDKLNLRPQERRIVVGVGVLVFVVLNLLFVMPHLNDLGKTELALDRARRSLQTYETEIAKTSISKERLKALQGGIGSAERGATTPTDCANRSHYQRADGQSV